MEWGTFTEKCNFWFYNRLEICNPQLHFSNIIDIIGSTLVYLSKKNKKKNQNSKILIFLKLPHPSLLINEALLNWCFNYKNSLNL